MLSVPYFGRTLLGIPAVHYRTVFAEMVNRTCADDTLRPDAIAVELGPSAADAVACWMKELGVGTRQAPLKCMLGLIRQNRRIHPKFKQAALLLQESTGKQLHDLSPEKLQRELGYAATALLCLSPTDSIIEAIRCAIELQVPLYGVDLEDPSVPARQADISLRDPISARGNLAAYVAKHEHEAALVRDEYSDGRRETVMAARLKTLLNRHKRVLFTGGLAHWQSICRLLADENLKPACNVPLNGPVVYERTLVHPQLAVRQMDLFPGITAAYEVARQPATSRNADRIDVDFQKQFRQCLERATAKFYSPDSEESKQDRSHENSHGVLNFGGYLLNHCLVSERLTPDLYTTLSSAKAMTSTGFVEVLADVLMDFNWASPTENSNLPIVGSATPSGAEERDVASRGVLKVPQRRSSKSELAYHRSAPFYVDPVHGTLGRKITEFPWMWQDEPKIVSEDANKYEVKFIWPPCENLFYASIYEAVNVADAMRREKQTEVFAGSLHEGIDLKASLRSSLQGKGDLFVNRTLRSTIRSVNGEPVAPRYSAYLELQPTVFIFSREENRSTMKWELLKPGDRSLYPDLSPRGKKMMDRMMESGDRYIAESIHVIERKELSELMKPWVNECYYLQGSIRFGNPCVNFYQSAVWLEKGRFKAAPSFDGKEEIQSICSMYRERHHMNIDLSDWKNALILFGLPYAHTTHRLVVVAPKGFYISKEVRHEAKIRNVELVIIPLSYFPAERIARIREQYSVMSTPGGKEYPPELERIFGQRQSKYRDLLPRQIAAQVNPKNNKRKAGVWC